MKRGLFFIIFFLVFFPLNLLSWEQSLLSRAEKTKFEETSRYDDVVDFLKELQKRSPLIKVTSIGKSTEDRDILLAILGDPVPASPTQLFIQQKPAIYIQANIHAGEVEGKEAMLLLMREILLGKLKHLLEHQVLLITPNYNPDGNEKISPRNRRNQLGPKGGVGIRYNGQNLDLNRDYIKLESPENSAAVRFILNQWDPMLLIDLHTTNGSYHREPLTYATTHNPNGDPSLPEYLRRKLFPDVAEKLSSKYDILSLPYGYFADSSEPTKGWRTFNHQPYYSTNYWGLRNRFAILNENYAYADYKTRIFTCYHFVELILEFTNKNAAEMLQLIHDVDVRTIRYGLSPDTSKKFGIEFEALPFEEPLLVRSYEFQPYQDEKGRKRVKKTDKFKDYTVPFYGNFNAVKSVTLPKGYLFSPNLKQIARKLLQHGIVVESLLDPVKLELQTFNIHKVEHGQRIYQGHLTTTLEGSYQIVEKELPAGTFYVGMDQPLANLVSYLLEPESDGGLVYWNFFDRYLRASQWGRRYNEFPVYRLLKSITLAKKSLFGSNNFKQN